MDYENTLEKRAQFLSDLFVSLLLGLSAFITGASLTLFISNWLIFLAGLLVVVLFISFLSNDKIRDSLVMTAGLLMILLIVTGVFQLTFLVKVMFIYLGNVIFVVPIVITKTKNDALS